MSWLKLFNCRRKAIENEALGGAALPQTRHGDRLQHEQQRLGSNSLADLTAPLEKVVEETDSESDHVSTKGSTKGERALLTGSNQEKGGGGQTTNQLVVNPLAPMVETVHSEDDDDEVNRVNAIKLDRAAPEETPLGVFQVFQATEDDCVGDPNDTPAHQHNGPPVEDAHATTVGISFAGLKESLSLDLSSLISTIAPPMSLHRMRTSGRNNEKQQEQQAPELVKYMSYVEEKERGFEVILDDFVRFMSCTPLCVASSTKKPTTIPELVIETDCPSPTTPEETEKEVPLKSDGDKGEDQHVIVDPTSVSFVVDERRDDQEEDCNDSLLSPTTISSYKGSITTRTSNAQVNVLPVEQGPSESMSLDDCNSAPLIRFLSVPVASHPLQQPVDPSPRITKPSPPGVDGRTVIIVREQEDNDDDDDTDAKETRQEREDPPAMSSIATKRPPTKQNNTKKKRISTPSVSSWLSSSSRRSSFLHPSSTKSAGRASTHDMEVTTTPCPTLPMSTRARNLKSPSVTISRRNNARLLSVDVAMAPSNATSSPPTNTTTGTNVDGGAGMHVLNSQRSGLWSSISHVSTAQVSLE